ncbi:MAG TPA: anaerobic sulfatase maturase [Clostridia bacterium]|nr:anaerobic sulfatase maturase [Clostridia bacterium]
MASLSLLIKPASSSCNLNCKYCFYHKISEKRSTGSFGIMDIDLLEIVVRKALEYAGQTCTFAFQGGEPTLAGLDFYKKLIGLQEQYNTKGIKINNTIQTNGIAIDEEWAQFLFENHFLVGLSLDGPKDIHDSMRVDAKGKGSFKKVMNAVRLFDKYKVEYNILFVVNSHTARHANKVYNFFKKNNFKYLQFIPCLDPLNEKPGRYEHSLTPGHYSQFLKSIFYQWYKDIINGDTISVRTFDNYLGIIMGMRPEACDMLGECSCQFVIEADGEVYPCDFYAADEWLLGNIKQNGFEEMKSSETAVRFIQASRNIHPECRICKWNNLCRGGCRRTREPFDDGNPSLSYFCTAYTEFFEYAMPGLYRLAKLFSYK